ncbi:Dockerin type I repeat protein [Rubripirellula obstinata]|uniref:Dockerin type I repeat protein n=1 Tax=Rubripirellula obstinata TaxID=406547 RepID=A0A5B1CHQ1_9BACT|nr:right-handed parallel beta-helix repeat-containing protein [Rubripirellula obstinata]KAA1259023.1 Dockerin type I repeat protein [Rubripirellula obstinata]
MFSTLSRHLPSIRKSVSQRCSKTTRRFQLRSELLESRQLLAGDFGITLRYEPIPFDSFETFSATNAAPQVNDIYVDVLQDSTFLFDPLDFITAFSDSDGDSLGSATILELPSSGTLQTSSGAVAAGEVLTLPLLSTLTYQPDPGFNGQDSALFSVTDDAVLRGDAPATSNEASVFINVIGDNQPPSVEDLFIDTEVNVTYQFDPIDFEDAFSDPEGDGLSFVTFGVFPSNGTLQLNGIELVPGQEVSIEDLSDLAYQPSVGFSGSDLLTFAVADDADLRGSISEVSQSATAFISVAAVNDPPIIGAAITEGAVVERTETEDAFDFVTLTAEGTLEFSDSDIDDTHRVNVSFQESSDGNEYGSFSADILSPTTGTGEGGLVQWEYVVGDSDISFLAPGEIVTHTYLVEIEDDAMGIDSSQITITLTGAVNNFVVDTVADTVDPTDGKTSLREAIIESNAVANDGSPNAIQFLLSFRERNEFTEDYEILLQEALPTITRPVTVVGYLSLRGDIVIDGSDLTGPGDDGIRVRSDDVQLRRLSVRNFSGDGVQFQDSANAVLHTLNVSENDRNGIFFVDTSDSLVANSIIHANAGSGIEVRGDATTGGDNEFEFNLIGVEPVLASIPVAAFNENFDGPTEGMIAEFEQASPNGRYGVLLRTSGNDVFDSIISGNMLDGIAIVGGSDVIDNNVEGNLIGTDSSGSVAIGNGRFGVLLNSKNSIVGGFGLPNLISGNVSHGVVIAGSGTTENVVSGNTIGLNLQGNSPVPNGGHGVFVNNASSNAIGGGGIIGFGNLISGNTASGISVTGESDSTFVWDNRIGVDATGTIAIGNGQHGLQISGGSTNSVVDGNTIAGNVTSQVQLKDSGTENNTISKNLIGVSQTLSGLQRIDGGFYAMRLFASNNTVGGSSIEDANVISGSQNGILLGTANASGNIISNNVIGGDGVSNDASFGMTVGINLASDSFNNTISKNTIANIAGDAIRSVNGGTGNLVSQNTFLNTNTEIDLGQNGPNPNDLGDIDTGPNNLQNKPVIQGVTANPVDGGLEIDVTFSVDSANYPVMVEFYRSNGDAPEQITYLGSIEVSDSTTTLFETFIDEPASLDAGEILATATDPSNSTSEFSFTSPLDVSGDGILNSLDSLMVVNFIARQTVASGEWIESNQAFSSGVDTERYDTNRDGKVSALDALLIINELSRSARQIEPTSHDDIFASLEDDEDFLLEPISEALLF